jgi:hypothetical protein
VVEQTLLSSDPKGEANGRTSDVHRPDRHRNCRIFGWCSNELLDVLPADSLETDYVETVVEEALEASQHLVVRAY